MEPVRKQFDFQKDFPISFVFKNKKMPQGELPEHFHDWYELVFVHDGAGTMFINSLIYEMRPGDLFIIPGNTIHRAVPHHSNPVTSTVVFFSSSMLQDIVLGESFSYLYCFDHCTLTQSFKLACSPRLQLTLEQLFNDIHNELQATRLGHRHAVLLLIHQLLLIINRSMGIDSESRALPSSHTPGWLQSSLLYINDHYRENISLQQLSANAAVSPAHFSRSFKQLTGMNVIRFIVAKRIIHAKELLQRTDLSVEEIASQCGFGSMPYFHRMFKRSVDMSPLAYRRSEVR